MELTFKDDNNSNVYHYLQEWIDMDFNESDFQNKITHEDVKIINKEK